MPQSQVAANSFQQVGEERDTNHNAQNKRTNEMHTDLSPPSEVIAMLKGLKKKKKKKKQGKTQGKT